MDDEFETERVRIFCARGPGHAELIPELWAYIATIYMHVYVCARACRYLLAVFVCVLACVPQNTSTYAALLLDVHLSTPCAAGRVHIKMPRLACCACWWLTNGKGDAREKEVL